MPVKAKPRKILKKGAVVPDPYVPASTKLKAWREHPAESVSAIVVPLGSLVHWQPQLTRPVVQTDVDEKKRLLIKSEGWSDSYNILVRILGEEDRDELKTVIETMRGPEADALECPDFHLWRTTGMHIKVRTFITHYRTLAYRCTLHVGCLSIDTHNTTSTQTHTGSC